MTDRQTGAVPDKVITAITELTRAIVEALVDDPKSIVVRAKTEETETSLRVQVAPGDVGKLIGKQGGTARSLRLILSAVSMKHHHRFLLDIVDVFERAEYEQSVPICRVPSHP